MKINNIYFDLFLWVLNVNEKIIQNWNWRLGVS